MGQHDHTAIWVCLFHFTELSQRCKDLWIAESHFYPHFTSLKNPGYWSFLPLGAPVLASKTWRLLASSLQAGFFQASTRLLLHPYCQGFILCPGGSSVHMQVALTKLPESTANLMEKLFLSHQTSSEFQTWLFSHQVDTMMRWLWHCRLQKSKIKLTIFPFQLGLPASSLSWYLSPIYESQTYGQDPTFEVFFSCATWFIVITHWLVFLTPVWPLWRMVLGGSESGLSKI